jgi:hypothetical protein
VASKAEVMVVAALPSEIVLGCCKAMAESWVELREKMWLM